MSEYIRIERPLPHIIEIVLNRPDKLNAINADFITQLSIALSDIPRDPEARVIILRGEGRAFSVGADVTRATAPGETYGAAKSAADDYARLDNRAKELFLAVWNCPLPIIAQVHGYCMGMSTIFMLCCDLVYCAEDAVIGWPTLPLGGGMIAPVWSHLVGPHRAKEMSFLIGSRLSGAEVAEWGVANCAVPTEALSDTVKGVATRIARLTPDLLRVKKAAINHEMTRNGFEEALRLGPVWDAVAHDTDVTRQTVKEIAELGLGEALTKWRA
ncbi:MAG TPA: enoyl-CoA hydratase-related protein [Terrimesophilobacter sp.]|mgnify:CR=1 FL=1|nr:enoyl-CoA hydratase-related protein [Terrimesophilobacter sp.]